MKNGKAPDPDRVTAEMLKGEELETPEILTKIFSKIWENEIAPDEWMTGLIIKSLKRRFRKLQQLER